MRLGLNGNKLWLADVNCGTGRLRVAWQEQYGRLRRTRTAAVYKAWDGHFACELGCSGSGGRWSRR